jgi:putative ABC transport system permease protein
MLLWITLKIALASLTANKLRSVLTMLGVIIGVGAVIAMLSLGTGFGQVISGYIGKLGTNVLFIRPGQRGMGVVTMVQTLTPQDGEAILVIGGVRAVSPWSMGSGEIKAGNRNTNSAIITGASPAFLLTQGYELARGRMFNDSEVRRQARVAVIGPKTAEDLFGTRPPIGQTIKIRGISFDVIGLLAAKGDLGRFNADDQAILPYTTAMHQLPPRRDYVQAIVQNMAQLLATFQAVSLGLTLFLGTIAAISLVVGGIGIMNIMLAAVAERTREIGIRKALGAKDRDILGQFLIEALVITLGGGLVGLGLGWGLTAGGAAVARNWLDMSATLQWWVVALSVAISTVVGLASGLYPAIRASRLDPVEALRYE